MAGWSEQNLELGDVKLRFLRGGSGRPVLVLHHDTGTLDDLPFYDALAGKFDVIVPRHPGFGVEERPNWMRHPRDIAALYQWLLADLGIAPALSGSASAAGSRPRWRPWRRATSTGSSWSARWASSRPRAISWIRRSSA